MTLKQIVKLFPAGSRVRVSRTGGKPLTIHGNTGTTVLPANDVQGEDRTIEQVKSKEWVMVRPDNSRVHTQFPKASEVIAARDGLLSFRYDNGVTVKIESIQP